MVFDLILRSLGYVRCRVCGKYTEPSIIFGDICSHQCLLVSGVIIQDTSKKGWSLKDVLEQDKK